MQLAVSQKRKPTIEWPTIETYDKNLEWDDWS